MVIFRSEWSKQKNPTPQTRIEKKNLATASLREDGGASEALSTAVSLGSRRRSSELGFNSGTHRIEEGDAE